MKNLKFKIITILIAVLAVSCVKEDIAENTNQHLDTQIDESSRIKTLEDLLTTYNLEKGSRLIVNGEVYDIPFDINQNNLNTIAKNLSQAVEILHLSDEKTAIYNTSEFNDEEFEKLLNYKNPLIQNNERISLKRNSTTINTGVRMWTAANYKGKRIRIHRKANIGNGNGRWTDLVGDTNLGKKGLADKMSSIKFYSHNINGTGADFEMHAYDNAGYKERIVTMKAHGLNRGQKRYLNVANLKNANCKPPSGGIRLRCKKVNDRINSLRIRVRAY